MRIIDRILNWIKRNKRDKKFWKEKNGCLFCIKKKITSDWETGKVDGKFFRFPLTKILIKKAYKIGLQVYRKCEICGKKREKYAGLCCEIKK